LYKSASFVVQAIAFRQTGNYIRRQKELLNVVSSDEQVIVTTFLNLKTGGAVDFHSMSETLFTWSKKWIGENR
ncbi:MAG: nucleotidyltransferase domain-containing protein, partial [Eubacteriales bacterium]|nr:nucleotidyltransferase domain-containing protein [Eubacteriales bacterium]